MSRFNMPAAINAQDQEFAYNHLFGLKYEPNSGYWGKLSYQFARLCIYINGKIDSNAISNIHQLTNEQSAIVLTILHRNPNKFKEEPYTKDFLKKFNLNSTILNSKNDQLFSKVAQLGNSQLLGKLLQLKPHARLTRKPLEQAVMKGDILSIDLLLNKDVDWTIEMIKRQNISLLDYAPNAEIFLYLVDKGQRQINQEEIFDSIKEESSKLDFKLYKEVIKKLNLNNLDFVTLLIYSNLFTNRKKIEILFEILKEKNEEDIQDIISKCNTILQEYPKHAFRRKWAGGEDERSVTIKNSDANLPLKEQFNKLVELHFPTYLEVSFPKEDRFFHSVRSIREYCDNYISRWRSSSH